MSSIHDVAKMAKVSLMTVSRVVNGDKNVKPSTQKRVQEAIDALDYHPNAIARALNSKRTMNIGLVLPKIEYVLSEPYFSSILYNLEKVLSLYNYNLLIDASEHAGTKTMSTLYDQKKVDGLIIIGSVIDDERVTELSEKHVPTVLVHAQSKLPGLSYIDLDNHQVIDCLYTYLCELGHERIGFITGDLSVLNAYDRLMAYKDCLVKAQREYDEDLVFVGDWSSNAGYKAFHYFNGLNVKPTAIISSNDHMAIGFIKGAVDCGVSIPEDVSVVGIDDIEMASYITPRLTTVKQPMQSIATMAFDALIRSMESHGTFESRMILNAEMVKRESCRHL